MEAYHNLDWNPGSHNFEPNSLPLRYRSIRGYDVDTELSRASQSIDQPSLSSL